MVSKVMSNQIKIHLLSYFQMEPLLKKLAKDITDETLVITCRYQFPIMYDRTIGEGIDAVWLYQADTIRQSSSLKTSMN